MSRECWVGVNPAVTGNHGIFGAKRACFGEENGWKWEIWGYWEWGWEERLRLECYWSVIGKVIGV